MSKIFPGFWNNLPQPIIGLSPMDGITDQPFRYITKKYGRPDVIFTEFIAAEGVAHNALKLFRGLIFDETQRPIVAQIFGKEPAAFRTTAFILCYLGFDGIDLNMGCPAKNVSQHGAGAALIQTPKLAQEIIRAAQAGVQDWVDGKSLRDFPELKQKTRDLIEKRHQTLPVVYQQRTPRPVSVKTRIGYDQPIIAQWLPYLLEIQPAAISIHGRTLKQGYGGRADWSAIGEAVKLAQGSGTLILGNGDLSTPDDIAQRVAETNVDGVLIGRATFGNPWTLDQIVRWRDGQPLAQEPTLADRAHVALEHAQQYERDFPGDSFFAMRKHLAWYIKGFPNASSLRTALVQTNSAQEVAELLEVLK